MPFHPSTTTHIKIDDMMKVISIFEKLGWKMDVSYDGISNYKDTFSKFCQFLACLDEKEIDLVINLSEDFLHCPYTVYPQLAIEALLLIPDFIIESCESVFLVPLINPKDIGNAKSSSGMLYSVLNTAMRNIQKLNDKNPKSYDNPDILLKNNKGREKSLILFLDDFIGSGDTAIEALKYYNDEIRNESDIPIVISLVAQIEGMVKIEDYGFANYTARIRDKCISDSMKIVDKDNAKKIIQKIENRMGVKNEYSLGYKKSEALVSMVRTPNNTLPIYWWTKKPNGEEWDGIFRRW